MVIVDIIFRLAPPFLGLVLLVEIVPPAGDLAILLATSSGNDRLAKFLSTINRDHVETRRRIPDLLDLVPVERPQHRQLRSCRGGPTEVALSYALSEKRSSEMKKEVVDMARETSRSCQSGVPRLRVLLPPPMGSTQNAPPVLHPTVTRPKAS